MRNTILASAALLLAFSASALLSVRARAAAAGNADELARQRLDAAQEGAKLVQSMYEQGMADFQAVSLWKRRVTSSELAMAKTKDQRMVALQKEVERAKEAEEMVRRRVSAGLAPSLDSVSAKYERLDAEAALAAEQQQP